LHTINAMKSSVHLVEVAPRDGLQNESRHLATDEKVELVARAVDAGARRVEVTGFARPDVVPALADAEELVSRLPELSGVEYSALVVNLRGLERAAAAGVRAVNMVVLATDTFSERNQGMTVDRALDAAEQVAAEAASRSIRVSMTVGAAFGCPFEGEVPLERLAEVVGRLAAMAPAEISLADTIGVATPRDVTERFALLADLAPGITARTHFHDTRNTGVANAVAALAAGVGVFDTSLAGIGGCPFAPAATGNLATEDLVYCLERMGVTTGLDLARLIDHAGWLTDLLGVEGGGRVRRAGGFPDPSRPTTLEEAS
jgi:hydroxymethylglutaryl-CoA lyase